MVVVTMYQQVAKDQRYLCVGWRAFNVGVARTGTM
jgi:hypothetical protein